MDLLMKVPPQRTGAISQDVARTLRRHFQQIHRDHYL
jgi:hypothetical protein